MPVVHVRRDGEAVDQKQFQNMLYIIKELDRDEFRLEADKEQAESKKGGVIHIWILGASSTDAKIAFVRPDWKLIMDGVEIEPGFRRDIRFSGKTVELRYGHYSFLVSGQKENS
jgi:hypothetical protein